MTTARLIIAAAVATAALGTATPAAAAFPPAGKLAEFCAANGDYRDGFCIGYITGHAYALSNRPGSGICVPATASLKQIRDNVTGYLSKHAPRVTDDGSVVVIGALRGAFPCKR
jgi:hypothetical protein